MIDRGTLTVSQSITPGPVSALYLSMGTIAQSPTARSDDEQSGRFSFEAEGSSDPSSRFFIGKLSFPGGKSGVTIGAGYDIGERTTDEVTQALIKAGFDSLIAARVAKGSGLKGQDAAKFVVDNSDIRIYDIGLLKALFDQTYPDYRRRAKERFDFHATSFQSAMKGYGKKFSAANFFPWNTLYPAIRVIAIDFVYQGFGKQLSGWGRPMHFCMANNFDWLIEYINDTPGLSQYEAGRHRAKYLRSKRDLEVANYSTCSP